ncbi:hypothetical protein CONPUDRAFT_144419 [Coniophora puteana RWD-64-598 SS2]|uniref:F-box domain-containing protein n=1 Tax=Coniophora puteana (strain RWD-64-598) TaxID=741705 RepID=A0A5M3MMB6_CONPW|nr:uncharacterized protein CONPUDRAFT_144419 [Coniophora puteana RWD-64-598 SS2]EIW80253.1 hypothetical protein CONPUDRAFT_144419 [Coniophora puteana RWD-64-598 SS2]
MVASWFSPSERQLRCVQFDEKIEGHFDAIRQPRTERNALSPICCLPPEVLAEIFTYATPTIHHTHRDLLTITHVCHHWREVALAYPNLWSNIDMDRRNPARIRALMLERAKNAPLALELSNNMYDKLQPAIFEELSQHIHHTRSSSLNILGLQTLDIATAVYHLVLDAPILKHLQFWLHGSPDTHTSVLLPEDFLGNTPRLRSMDLLGVVPPWHSSVFRGLTRLGLWSLYDLSPTAEELWAILRGSPALEEIRQFHGTSTPKIFASYVHFFTNVRVPSHAHFHLGINILEEGLPNSLTIFPSTFLTSIREDTEPTYSISVFFGGPRGILSIYQDNGQFQFPYACNHHSDLACGKRITATIGGPVNHFHFLCHDPPLTSIHTLKITVHEHPDDVPWGAIFETLPQLQFLNVEVNRSMYLSLTSALMPQAEHVPAPRLIDMRLSSLAPSEALPHGDIQRLIDTLERRSQAGYHIDRLTCEDIPVDPAELEQLERLARNVSLRKRTPLSESSTRGEEQDESTGEDEESGGEDDEDSQWDEESDEEDDDMSEEDDE